MHALRQEFPTLALYNSILVMHALGVLQVFDAGDTAKGAQPAAYLEAAALHRECAAHQGAPLGIRQQAVLFDSFIL